MLTDRDFITGFRKLGIDQTSPVIVHASLSAFGEIRGGAETVMQALLSSYDTVVMPVFTYKTMITPEVGPPDNAIVYGGGKDTNRQAEIFTPDMPADKTMGILAETFRAHPGVQRSVHPILSFAGIYARSILDAQTMYDPLLPIQSLIDMDGWVLLMGVNHTVNTSIHYGEKLVKRKQFVRWALTTEGVVTCWGFPGCSDGFEAVSSRLEGVVSRVSLGKGLIQAVPLLSLMDAVCGLLKEDPLALLCERQDCPRCNAVRASAAHLPADLPG